MRKINLRRKSRRPLTALIIILVVVLYPVLMWLGIKMQAWVLCQVGGLCP